MSYSHSTVIDLFSRGITNKTGCNVYSEGDTLFSYGTHFPLVQRRSGEDNLINRGEWFLLNGDKYSSSTSKHQSITYRLFEEYPRVSFSAINAAGISYRTCELIDFTKDEQRTVYQDDPGFDEFNMHIPAGAEYHETRNEDGTIYSKAFHRIGSVVLKQADKYYLCSMDEGNYFVSLLPCPVQSVNDAFEVLKPSVVRNAEGNGVETKRQGEWFFIPMSNDNLTIRKKDLKPQFILPSGDSASNLHIATKGIELETGFYYVTGMVRHRSPRTGRATGQHKRLTLGERFFLAVCNTAQGNWSASGRVD